MSVCGKGREMVQMDEIIQGRRKSLKEQQQLITTRKALKGKKNVEGKHTHTKKTFDRKLKAFLSVK